LEERGSAAAAAAAATKGKVGFVFIKHQHLAHLKT
jgi:hypothetical protein